MPLKEGRIVRLTESECSIAYDGIPLSGGLSIQERLEIYRQLAEEEEATGQKPPFTVPADPKPF